MSGGHFLHYDTLHLTEMALSFDYGVNGTPSEHFEAFNAVHHGMMRKIYRMAIALPILSRTRRFRLRSIIAMAAIIYLEPKSVVDMQGTVSLKQKDALSQELMGEHGRSKRLMDKVMQQWGVANPQVELRKGLWRDPGPLVSLEFLHAS